MADTKAGTAVAEQPAERTQLEKAEAKTPEVITRPDEYTAALKKWNEHFNVLSPFVSISGIAAQHGLIASQVRINTDAAYGREKVAGGGEVYGGLPFLTGTKGQPNEELALAKLGLRKIAECAGISVTTVRTDPRLPNYWEMKAIASYRGIDGSIFTREATMEWDLRDGSERMKGWTANQITEGRKNGLRNCEARAINAVIRECGCGIKQKYTRAELAKPFLVLRVAFQPDYTDPEQRRMVTEAGLRSTSMLYGGGPALAAHAGREVVDGDVVSEPRSVGSGMVDPPASDPDQPPVEGAVRIVKVDEKKGVNEKTKRPWVRFEVVDHNGEVCSTFDTKLAEAALKAMESKAWVELSIEQNGSYRNLIEIMPAGAQPKLPDMSHT